MPRSQFGVYVVAVTIFTIASGGLVLLFFFADSLVVDSPPRLEILKSATGALAQLAALGIAGAVVKMMLDHSAALRTVQDARRSFQHELIRRLLACGAIERSARTAISSSPTLETYRREMDKLSDMRNELIEIVEEVKISGFQHSQSISKALFIVVVYFQDLLYEYETTHAKLVSLDAQGVTGVLSSLPKLSNFRHGPLQAMSDPEAANDWEKMFNKKYSSAKRQMREW